MDASEAPLSADDREAIVAAATDYIESWLDGEPERMGRALHPDLVKRAVDYDDSFSIDTITREQMVEVTAAGRGRRHERPFEVTILDAFGDVASVRVLSVPYVDYLHVARVADGWQILNVLWQWRPGRQ